MKKENSFYPVLGIQRNIDNKRWWETWTEHKQGPGGLAEL